MRLNLLACGCAKVVVPSIVPVHSVDEGTQIFIQWSIVLVITICSNIFKASSFHQFNITPGFLGRNYSSYCIKNMHSNNCSWNWYWQSLLTLANVSRHLYTSHTQLGVFSFVTLFSESCLEFLAPCCRGYFEGFSSFYSYFNYKLSCRWRSSNVQYELANNDGRNPNINCVF